MKRVVLIGTIALAIGIALVCFSLHTAKEAEFNLHARICATEVVRQFVEDSKGKWPKSWSELAKTKGPSAPFRWPENLEDIKSRVTIKFDVELKELLAGDAEHFDAIRLNGVTYGDNSWVKAFLESLRKVESTPR